MKIVVIGGTGLIGSKLVAALRQRDHEVLAASPDSGVNTLTGEGLAPALAGAQVVVDVSNSPSFEDAAVMKFFETSSSNLLAAEAKAGVRHHVALSVVGADRMTESGYMRAKTAQENLIKASGIPYTILRSTQFFEFMGRIADSFSDGKVVRASPALVQPIVSDDAVAALADVTLGDPANDTLEVAGPERVPARRAHPSIPGLQERRTGGDAGRSRPLLRYRAGRSISRAGRQPTDRRNEVRYLAEPPGAAEVSGKSSRGHAS